MQGGAPVNLTIDTACQVWTSSPSQQSTLSFAASWSKPPQGVNLSLANSNSQLVLSASGSANPGETGIVNVSIPGTSASSKLLVEVLPAPLPTIAAVNIPSAKAGTAISIDMSQFVSSPIPNAQIKVTALHQNGASNATVSFAGSVVNITPAVGVNGVLTFSVSVTDEASQAASRTVTGVITVQVLDVPGAPGPIQGVPGNQQVALSWTAAPSNGAPIDYYQVSVNGGSAVNVPGTSYVWTGLTNGTQYQFTVRAHNSVGLSTAQSTAFFAPQSVPGPPGAVSAVPGNGEVALSWGASNPNGQPVSYLVSVSPAPSSGQSSVNVSSTSYTWSGLNNNVGPYIFTVTPLNKVGSGTPAQSSAVYAFGVPPTPSAPSASGSVSPDQSTTTVTVSWPVSPLCNDARPCASYIVTELKNGVPFQTVGPSSPTCSSGNGDCVSFGPIVNDGSSYTYELQQINRENQTSPISAASTPPIQAVGVPAAVTNLAVSPGNHSLNVTFSIPASHGSLVSLVKYTATNGSGGASVAGSWANPGATGSTISETIGGLSNGDTYTISVQACNELGECAPSSNTVSSFPYGPPFAPTVNDTSSGNVITYTWSGGGGNGRPVSAYYVCIDGSCANEGSQVGSKSITYSLSTCGTPHSVYAYVLDNASPPEQSPNSSTATAATAACAPPTPPSVSTSLSGNTVTYAWSGGGGNGQTISYYQLCVDGNCSNVGSAPGQTQVNYPCGVNAVTHSAYGTVVMAATQYQVAQTSSPSPTASVSIAACPPPTPPTVTASANGDTITYTWAGGNGNGLPISYYVLCVDGSCSNVGAAPGQEQVTYPCGQTHSAYGQIVVANSVTSANSSTVSATTAACAPPSLSISFNSGTSGYTTFAWSNFPSGYNTFTCYFKVAPTVGGPYSYSFAAGSGSVSSGTCYSFTSGDTIQVVVSGPGLPNVTSNTLSVQ